MKQALSVLFLILFMFGATYLLLNEGKGKRASSRAKNLGGYAKFISEKPKAVLKPLTRDPQPFELQRQRINNEAVIRFQNVSTHESYELNEDELMEFSTSFNKFKSGIDDRARIEVGRDHEDDHEEALREYVPAD